MHAQCKQQKIVHRRNTSQNQLKYTAIDNLHTASENINKTHIYSKSVKTITIFTELTYLSDLSHSFMFLQERSVRKGKTV